MATTTKHAYRITLRHGGTFTLHSENDLHSITEKITVTPASVSTTPYWVFDDDTAIFTADIVAIERIADVGSPSAVVVVHEHERPDRFQAGLAAGYEEGRRHGRR